MSERKSTGGSTGGTEAYRAAKAKRYFSRSGFAQMLQAIWHRYASLEKSGGHAVVRCVDADECETINSFFGWCRKPGDDIRISLEAFEQELRESAFPYTIPELYEVLTGSPLLTKTDRELLAERDWQDLFRLVEEEIQLQPVVLDWLGELKNGTAAGYRTLRELWRASAGTAERELASAARAWNMLLTEEAGMRLGGISRSAIRLPVLAALATGNPHALDRNMPAGRLLFQALRSSMRGKPIGEADTLRLSEQPNVSSGIDSLSAREIYRMAGVLDDDISSSVHVYNPWDRMEAGPYVMTLRQVEAASELSTVNNIYVVENPAVFSTLVDVTEELLHGKMLSSLSGTGPLLLCTSGPASAAALRLLDRYMEEGHIRGEMYYSGDFDIKGVEMGNVMADRYGIRFVPWYFDAGSYLKGCATAGFEALTFSEEERIRLGKTRAAWDNELCREMGIKGVKLFQEQLMVQLAEDWAIACKG